MKVIKKVKTTKKVTLETLDIKISKSFDLIKALNNKIDKSIKSLDVKIKQLDIKIDKSFEYLNNKIDKSFKYLNTKIDCLDYKIDKSFEYLDEKTDKINIRLDKLSARVEKIEETMVTKNEFNEFVQRFDQLLFTLDKGTQEIDKVRSEQVANVAAYDRFQEVFFNHEGRLRYLEDK